MKKSVYLVFILLVIGPTAVLSLLAARNVRDQAALLDLRRQRQAETELQRIEDEMIAAWHDSVYALRAPLAAALTRAEMGELRTLAARLEAAAPLCAQLYVFMNPWGFVVPDDSGRALTLGGGMDDPAAHDLLAETLRRRLTGTAKTPAMLEFELQGHVYAFTLLNEARQLYVGSRLDRDEFARQLRVRCDLRSGDGLKLAAEIPWQPAAGRAVVVADSLGGQELLTMDPVPSQPLARLELELPLAGVALVAYPAAGGGGRVGGMAGAGLYRWGILLLAVVILAGAGAGLLVSVRAVRDARARSGYVIGVSHDLRTPLTSMRMLAESLLLGHVAGEQRREQFLRTILAESRRLEQLIERILYFVRFGQNALTLRLQPEDPVAMVRESIAAFRGMTGGEEATEVEQDDRTEFFWQDRDGRRVELVLIASASLPPVAVDRTALGQVLLNLLDNGWKYTEGELVRLELDLRRVRARAPWRLHRRGYLLLAVRDAGSGMSRRERRRIFRSFYRGRRAAQVNTSGVGLGLAMCKRIIALHRGWIDVRSRPGRGSEFRVMLLGEEGGGECRRKDEGVGREKGCMSRRHVTP